MPLNLLLYPGEKKQLMEYFYFDEVFIHEISTKTLRSLIYSNTWQTLNQQITSAETNDDANQVPDIESIKNGDNASGIEAFFDLEFDAHVQRVLDVGGGKYDYSKHYMRTKGIELLVWDPYNRSKQHNETVQGIVAKRSVDAATSMSVLNVIQEPAVRLAHISTLKEALELNGKAYFKVWPGRGLLKGSYQPTINSYGLPGYQANAYADRFLREVQLVFGLDNAWLHDSIPNTIVAQKISNNITTLDEIELIQKLSEHESWHVRTCKK